MTDEQLNAFLAAWHHHCGGAAYAEAALAVRALEQRGWKFVPPATDKDAA